MENLRKNTRYIHFEVICKNTPKLGYSVPIDSPILLDKFNTWMGHGRQSWYTGLEIGNDSAEGLYLRRRMAEGMSED